MAAAGLWAAPGSARPRAAAACRVTQSKSLSGTSKTTIKFVNKTSGPVQLYWLDYKGHLVYYTTVPAGASRAQPTFKTHPWLAFNAGFTCIGYVIAPKTQYVVGP